MPDVVCGLGPVDWLNTSDCPNPLLPDNSLLLFPAPLLLNPVCLVDLLAVPSFSGDITRLLSIVFDARCAALSPL